jgi:hypothetical protein
MPGPPPSDCFLAPDRPVADWLYHNAYQRVQECRKYLWLANLTTDAEDARIKHRIAKWYDDVPCEDKVVTQ